MKTLNCIIWDFDGVILFSNAVRRKGFEIIFKDFPKESVNQLLEYHELNGGLSRYIKIRYFFEEILKQSITSDRVDALAEEFSFVMKFELTNKELLNKEWIEAMYSLENKYEHHIASGSDGLELRYLCQELEVSKYFHSINGSPTTKNELVSDILTKTTFPKDEVILIGDSINDFEAAKANGIDFYGYNNRNIIGLGSGYIEDFNDLV